jgi:hypothetical protein
MFINITWVPAKVPKRLLLFNIFFVCGEREREREGHIYDIELDPHKNN